MAQTNTGKKALSYAWQELKRMTDGIAGQENSEYTTSVSYTEVHRVEYSDRSRPVGLRPATMNQQSGYQNSTENERLRTGHGGYDGGSNEMQDVQLTGGWQEVNLPLVTSSHTHPVEQGGDGKYSSDVQTVEEQISDHASGGAGTPKKDPRGSFADPKLSEAIGSQRIEQTHSSDPTATLGNAADFLDPTYLNLSNNLVPFDPRQEIVERGPPPSSSRVENLQNENAALQEAIQELHKTLATQKRESDKEKNELKAKLATYVRKTHVLNQIIIKNASQTNEPSDTVIEKETREICSEITKIIRLHFAGKKLLIDISRAKQLKDDRFYKILQAYGPETKRRLLSERLFALLNTGIFSANIFGLDVEAERHFEKFEREILASPGVSRKDAEEWRVRTVSCASHLDLTAPLFNRVDHLSKWIWGYFSPMELSGEKKNTHAGIEDIMADFRLLCEKSIKLKLRFRSCETRYAFSIPTADSFLGDLPPGTYVDMGSEGELTPEAEEDVKKRRVYCVLFGALMKTKAATAVEEEKAVVIFPANVITYEDARDRERDLREREKKDKEGEKEAEQRRRAGP